MLVDQVELSLKISQCSMKFSKNVEEFLPMSILTFRNPMARVPCLV